MRSSVYVETDPNATLIDFVKPVNISAQFRDPHLSGHYPLPLVNQFTFRANANSVNTVLLVAT